MFLLCLSVTQSKLCAASRISWKTGSFLVTDGKMLIKPKGSRNCVFRTICQHNNQFINTISMDDELELSIQTRTDTLAPWRRSSFMIPGDRLLTFDVIYSAITDCSSSPSSLFTMILGSAPFSKSNRNTSNRLGTLSAHAMCNADPSTSDVLFTSAPSKINHRSLVLIDVNYKPIIPQNYLSMGAVCIVCKFWYCDCYTLITIVGSIGSLERFH